MAEKLPYLRLHCGLSWRCVLLTHQFEFFVVLVGSQVIHASQLVELKQRQFAFAQITQFGLTVVLSNVLISSRRFGINLIENHTVFIKLWVWLLRRLMRLVLLGLVSQEHLRWGQDQLVVDLEPLDQSWPDQFQCQTPVLQE